MYWYAEHHPGVGGWLLMMARSEIDTEEYARRRDLLARK
jgi:hypothetical protein